MVRSRTRVVDSDNEEAEQIESEPGSPSMGTDSSTLITPQKKRKIEKCLDDAVPLPNPFPLPKHYSAEVEASLKKKQLSSSARRQFVNSIASAMLYYKRYPTKEDYQNVGSAIITTYPFMKSPAGSPAVSAYACMHTLHGCLLSTWSTFICSNKLHAGCICRVFEECIQRVSSRQEETKFQQLFSPSGSQDTSVARCCCPAFSAPTSCRCTHNIGHHGSAVYV